MEHQENLGLITPKPDQADSSVLDSVLRNWPLVLGFAAAGLGAALLFALLGPPAYETSTSIVVEDPRASATVSQAASDPERYVADQVGILQSHAVAQRATEILAETGIEPPLPSPEDLLPDGGKLDVSNPTNSNVIDITFIDRRPDVARAGAVAVLEAYEEVTADEAARSAASAVEELEAHIADVDAQIEELAAQIETSIPPEMRTALETQSIAILGRVIELQADLVAATTQAEIDAIDAQLAALASPIDAVQSLLGALSPANLQGLLDQQSALIGRRADLTASRDAIVVNSELTPAGVTFVSPPAEPSRADLSVPVAAVLGLLLGLVSGAGVARWRVVSERRLANHEEPSQILGSPLLADIPMFSIERLSSHLPVRDHSKSVAAESFRFAAASLAVRLKRMDMTCVSVVSGRTGDGKSTVVANLGYAATRLAPEGFRTLLIDGDFASQSLTKALSMPLEAPGLTDAALDETPLPFAIHEVKWAGADSMFLLGKGSQPVDPQSFFWSEEARLIFQKVRGDFDLVIIDTPALLQVAYASTLAGLSESSLVVARHEAQRAELAAVRDKLSLIGVPTVGYVYSHAPMREWMVNESRSSEGRPSVWSRMAESARSDRIDENSSEATDSVRRA